MVRKQLPNFLTLCNLATGCLGIIYVLESPPYFLNLGIITLIMLACLLFDLLDGLVARALKASSEIGVQLDSLADLVSFGVFPGIMIYRVLRDALPIEKGIGSWGLNKLDGATFTDGGLSPLALLAILIPVLTAIRLARFNLDKSQQQSFKGLPSPLNALFLFSLFVLYFSISEFSISGGLRTFPLPNEEGPLWVNFTTYSPIPSLLPIRNDWLLYLWSHFGQAWQVLAFSLGSSLLMLSPLRMLSLKFKSRAWKDNVYRYLLLFSGISCILVFSYMGIPILLVLYLVLSILSNYEETGNFLGREIKPD